GAEDDPRGGVARRRGAPAARGGGHEEPRRDARLPDRALAQGAPRQARRVRGLDDRGSGHGAAPGARRRRSRRDPRQDGRAAGVLAQARRGAVRRSGPAGPGVCGRRGRRRARLRRRGRRGRRVRGRRRGGADLVSEEQVEQQEETEAQDERPVPGTAEPGQAPPEDDRLLRLAADFENYKKRAARERQEYVQLANERLIVELIPILDDLERALAAAEQHEEAQLEEGVELVHRSLAALLAHHGVTPIETEGKFDPHVHEALLSQPSEAAEGSVLDVVQKGYKLGERVVRPARVVVAAPPAQEEPEGDA